MVDSKSWSKQHRVLWLDFETWLYENFEQTLEDLSWSEYIEKSKLYNSERNLREKGI